MPEPDNPPSRFRYEVEAVRSRLHLSLARKAVLDLIGAHYDEIKTPKPTRWFLYHTCFDAMVLDLTVCWEAARRAEASLLSIAKRLLEFEEQPLSDYAGQDAVLTLARQAGQFVAAKHAELETALKPLFDLRDKRIGHLDRHDALPHENVPANSIELVQASTGLALDELDKVTPSYLGFCGGDIIVKAGSNLIADLMRKEPE